MKKIGHYALAATLVIPSTVAFVGEANAATTVKDTTPSATTTNVANTHRELEQLINVRLFNHETYFELHFNRNKNQNIQVKDLIQHVESYLNENYNLKEENPYLGWSIKNNKVEGIDGQEKMTMAITVEYRNTLDQEVEVDKLVEAISNEIITANMTNFEKTKAIYDYVTTDHLLTTLNQSDTAKSVHTLLKKNNGASLAYALFMYRLLTYNKIQAKVIEGSILGAPPTNLDAQHFWNYVYLDNRWYHIDAALGSGYTGLIEVFPYDTFLLSTNTMRKTHNWKDYSNIHATDAQYEKYRTAKKLDISKNYTITINPQDQLVINNKKLDGYRVQDFAYDAENNWIYFIGLSHGSYLYKIRPDGTGFTVVNREQGKKVAIKKNGKTQQLVYRTINGRDQATTIELQADVDKRDAKNVERKIDALDLNHVTVNEVADIRVDYNQLSPDARLYLPQQTETKWAVAQNKLTPSEKKVVDVIVVIALLDDLKPTYRTDVEAARKNYDALSQQEQRDVSNYRELTNAEQQVVKNLSLAFELDKTLEKLNLDMSNYQEQILRSRDTFHQLTFAQQTLVTQDQKLYNMYEEVKKYNKVGADFDYRLEVLEDNDPRLIEKVQALRELYDTITIGEERNIKRYDRLLTLERTVQAIENKLSGWQGQIDNIYTHMQQVQNATVDEPVEIVKDFVERLILLREAYTKFTPAEQALLTDEYKQLEEMEAYAKMRFRDTNKDDKGVYVVIELEKAIDQLYLDSRELEKQMTPVLDRFYQLTENEQYSVQNYKRLLRLEKALPYKKDIVTVMQKIDKTNQPMKWTQFKAATYDARLSYDRLPEDAKPEVSNYSDLLAAEKKVKEGNKEEDPKPPVIKPPTSNDQIVVEGKQQATEHTFDILNSIVTKTIAEEGTKDLHLTSGDVDIILPAQSVTDRLANVTDARVTFDSKLAHAATLTITLDPGKRNARHIDYLADYAQITLPADLLTEDSDDLHLLATKGTSFAAIPFYVDDANSVIIKPRTVGKYNVMPSFVNFTDIRHSDYQDEINFLANRYIIKGKTATTFDPYSPLTRAQFSMMVARALDAKPSANTENPFSDTKGIEAEQDILALYELDIIHGVNKHQFKPYQQLTRQQALVMMKRMLESLDLELDYDNEKPEGIYDWGSMSAEAQEAYLLLAHLGVLEPKDGYLKPYSALQRQEMANMLKRTVVAAELY